MRLNQPKQQPLKRRLRTLLLKEKELLLQQQPLGLGLERQARPKTLILFVADDGDADGLEQFERFLRF